SVLTAAPSSADVLQQPGAAQFCCLSLLISPMCISEDGTYHAIITLTVFCSPGCKVNGTNNDAPGASASTGGVFFISPFLIVFHIIVKGSHQPPRNQQ